MFDRRSYLDTISALRADPDKLEEIIKMKENDRRHIPHSLRPVAAVAAALALLTAVNFGQRSESERVLKITIPESLDYDSLFDDLFDQYTRSHTLERVKTANMGTLYELEYRVTLPGEQPSKEFLDALRCRNGNLNIVCGRPAPREAL